VDVLTTTLPTPLTVKWDTKRTDTNNCRSV